MLQASHTKSSQKLLYDSAGTVAVCGIGTVWRCMTHGQTTTLSSMLGTSGAQLSGASAAGGLSL